MADLNEENSGGKTQIIMKVEAPPEDSNTNQEPSDHEDPKSDPMDPSENSQKSQKTQKSPNAFTLRSSLLGPSKSSVGFVLRPSALENCQNCQKNSENFEKNSENLVKNGSNSQNQNGPNEPKFMPLAIQDNSKQNLESETSTNLSSTPNFVFGQNLLERIVAETETSSTNSSTVPNSSQESSTVHTNSNGTSTELLFSSAVKSTQNTQNTQLKTLSESAREYEESRANKRKYEQVIVLTGEEDEINILQINCKLFAFDKSGGNWQEMGRGTLRLNDREILTSEGDSFMQSRLVIRTSGSLRVVLNTKIWAEMTIDLASQKSLRLTAMDANGQIKVFLIMANPEEINKLHKHLKIRVSNEIDRHKNQPKEPDVKKPAVEKSTNSD